MRKDFFLYIFIFFISKTTIANEDYVKYVNPLIGTDTSFELSNGNTYPAIARPWGMNFWTPQTGKMGDGWTYTYKSDELVGFKQTHQPSPWINDYAAFSLMPSIGKSSTVRIKLFKLNGSFNFYFSSLDYVFLKKKQSLL